MSFPQIFDNSMRATLVACPEKFRLSFLANLAPNKPSVHLHAGGCFAAALDVTRQAFYGSAGLSEQDSLCLGATELIRRWGEPDVDGLLPFSEEDKNLGRMLWAFDDYFREYRLPSDPIKPLLANGRATTEFSFSIPMELEHPDTGEPLLFAGRFDMLGSFQDSLFVIDEKTTSMLGSSWGQQWELKCFTEDHELLTDKGWKPIADITKDDRVVQATEKGDLSFTLPLEVYSYDYTGSLISIEGRRCSLLVTPNHRILVEKRYGGHAVFRAEELKTKAGQQDSIPLAGKFEGEEILSEPLQRFVAAVQADAALKPSKGEATQGRGHREHMPHRSILFSFTKERKHARIRDLLLALDVPYTEHANGSVYISGFTWLAELIDSLLDENKCFISGTEQKYSKPFLNELLYWDGWAQQYYTKHKQNAEFVASVAAMQGKAASVNRNSHDHYTVVFSRDVRRQLKRCIIKSVPFSGKVYCVSVPSSFLLVRRNGQISITGNSQFTGYCAAAKLYGYPVAGAIIRGVGLLKNSTTFQQVILYRPEWQIERWWNQLHRDIHRAIQLYRELGPDASWDRTLDEACAQYGGCAFRRLCLSQEPERWVEGYFTERNWNPLDRH